MQTRALLAVIISLIILVVYQAYFAPVPEKAPEKPAASAPAGQVPGEAKEQAKGVSPAEKIPGAPAGGPAQLKAQPGKDVTIDTPLYTAVFNTRGARLKDFRVKAYLDKIGQGAKPIDLARENLGTSYPFGVEIAQPNFPFSADSVFEADTENLKLGPDKNKGEVNFTWKSPDGVQVRQQMVFYGDNYHFDVNLQMANLSSRAVEGRPALVWLGKVHADSGGGMSCIPGSGGSSSAAVAPFTALVKKEFQEFELKDIKDEKRITDPVEWGGFQDQYFLAAFVPRKTEGTELVLRKISDTAGELRITGPVASLPPSTQVAQSYVMFLGPKDLDKLKAFGHNLDKALDFGWFDIVAKPMLYAMKFFYQYTGNWGLAIILLTVIIKIIFWWPTNLSYRSMKEMKKIQPEMAKLREKFKDDKEKLNKEMMELYRRYKVNPMGGCLPMAIQIPVFFALYKVLLYSIELRHAPFYWWIQDLSAADPYYISPILMGASMFVQQYLTPTAGDPTQAKMMLAMPVVFTFMFLSFPTGLVIYWFFSNLLSIGQQLYINQQNR
ncbi:MAG TPA: membrane protein insertase YidC [Thermodesulfobacteriota bacterium]|nr:membrane protein insertase YidC [Thermodesulfobacteriota bacterium]